MKKFILLLFILASSIIVYAQSSENSDAANAKKDLVITAADLKSGTSQDVLASFFKLGFKDIINGHQLQFNSSIFALKAKTDSDLWKDFNYKQQTFARNFVFGFGLSADSTFAFKSAIINVKYALINNRDKDLFNYAQDLDRILIVTNNLFRQALNKYLSEMPSDADIDLARFFYYQSPIRSQTPIATLPSRYRAILDSLKQQSDFGLIVNVPLAELSDYVDKNYKTAAELMSQRSLWTIGSQITLGPHQLSRRTNFNSEYLKGITKNGTAMGLELDIKVDMDIYDSTVVAKAVHRNMFTSSAGINWIIYKNKTTQKSYVEFKPALTYYNVLSGNIPGESKSKFTGDGVLRFRITDDLWIPFDIKYYPDSGKIFGFLNITANFDWLKGNSKTLN